MLALYLLWRRLIREWSRQFQLWRRIFLKWRFLSVAISRIDRRQNGDGERISKTTARPKTYSRTFEKYERWLGLKIKQERTTHKNLVNEQSSLNNLFG